MIEKRVFNLHIVAAKDVDKVLTTCVASCYAIWPEDLLMFVTSPCADTSIDVGAYNNLCVQIDIRKDRVKHVANRLCCLSLQGKYTNISAIEMYLPLMHLPRLSKEVHMSLRQIILPENSSSGPVVIGGRDPAARHAW